MGRDEFSVIIIRGNRLRATRNEKAWPPKQAFLATAKTPALRRGCWQASLYNNHRATRSWFQDYPD